MNENLPGNKLTTADIANPQRTTPLNANQNMPDLSPEKPVSRQDNSPGFASGQSTTASGQPGAPVANPNPGAGPAGTKTHQDAGPLFAENELRDFRARWDQAQGAFVDEPRKAVEQADSLVASLVHHIAEQFANERAGLEKQWDRGDDVSTEDLRQALKRYRAFFDRLLSF